MIGDKKEIETSKKLDAIHVLYDMHCTNPEPSSYDLGFVNGLAIAISILTGQPPRYVYRASYNPALHADTKRSGDIN